MIPLNAFTAAPVYSEFIAPYNQPFHSWSQTVLGGLAIGNASSGRATQNWVMTYDGVTIRVSPENGATAFTYAVSGASNVSLAFDNNMAVVLCWMAGTSAFLYYYDTVTLANTVRSFPGFTSCRVVVDDARLLASADSDVIFGYTNAGNLYWRQQRERYNTERLIGATTKRLKRMAPSTGNRLQFELR